MQKTATIGCVLLALVALLPGAAVSAHGLEIDYTLTPVMALRIDLALADAAGEPLVQAAVDVYAPDRDEPWFSTKLGKDAALSLVPDTMQPGEWVIDAQKDAQRVVLRIPLEFGAGYARVPDGAAIAVDAQNARVTYTLAQIATVAVALDAAFEGGDVMADAQVTVYAPDNAKTPWLTGTADASGHYVFVADITRAGTWDIQVRKAGHGEWINVTLDADSVEMVEIPAAGAGMEGESAVSETTLHLASSVSESASVDEGYSTGQIVLMTASVIWGLVGTALYFARRRDTPAQGGA